MTKTEISSLVYQHVLGVEAEDKNLCEWEHVERVIQQMNQRYHLRLNSPFEPGQPWFAGFTPHSCSVWNGRPDHQRSGESAGIAICLAALDACGVEIQQCTEDKS